MPAEEILVGLGSDVIDDVMNAKDELVLDGRDPRVVVHLQDRPRAQEVQVAELGRKNGESVSLDVKFPEVLEFSNLLGKLD